MRYLITIVLSSFLLISTAYAGNKNNICNIMSAHPSWYNSAMQTQEKWGVPVAVQMAIMHKESNFKANADNPHSTAYGFSQALNSTWRGYQKSVGSTAKRNNFSAASDFIGWYADQANQDIGIQPTNAYNLYIAYHDGAGAYKKARRNPHSLAARLAKSVQKDAVLYTAQLNDCGGSAMLTTDDADTSASWAYWGLVNLSV